MDIEKIIREALPLDFQTLGVARYDDKARNMYNKRAVREKQREVGRSNLSRLYFISHTGVYKNITEIVQFFSNLDEVRFVFIPGADRYNQTEMDYIIDTHLYDLDAISRYAEEEGRITVKFRNPFPEDIDTNISVGERINFRRFKPGVVYCAQAYFGADNDRFGIKAAGGASNNRRMNAVLARRVAEMISDGATTRVDLHSIGGL